MNKIKTLMRKLAGKVVTYYYNRLYRQAVKLADKRHGEEGEMIYIVDHFIKGQTLSCINRKEFRWMKHAAQKLHRNEMFYSYKYGVQLIKDGAWYHTADRSGNGGLTKKEIEIRRLAFIRSGLKKAGLLSK